MKNRFFNRMPYSLAVALNDGTTGCVRSKRVLEVESALISADLLVKVKKGFLVRMRSVSVAPVVYIQSSVEQEIPAPKEPETTFARYSSDDEVHNNIDTFLNEIT